MPESIADCPDARLDRRVAFFRFCRLPLAAAVAVVSLYTIQASVSCLSSPTDEQNVSSVDEPETDDPTAEHSPIAEPASIMPSTVEAKPPARATPPVAAVSSRKPEPASKTPKSLPRAVVQDTTQARAAFPFKQPQADPPSPPTTVKIAAAQKPTEPPSIARPWLCDYARKLTTSASRFARDCVVFGEDFWQFSGHVGERFARRAAAVEQRLHKFLAQQASAKSKHRSAAPKTDPGTERAPEPSGLVLLNPQETGGAVLYLLNGQAHSLRPGQRQDLPSGSTWRVQFHRGEDFGDADQVLTSGTYRFRVTERGWDLSRTEETASGSTRSPD